MLYSNLSRNENVPHSYICDYHRGLVSLKNRTVGPVKIKKRKRIKASAYFLNVLCDHKNFSMSCNICLLRYIRKDNFRLDYGSMIQDGTRQRERDRMLECGMKVLRIKHSDFGMGKKKYLSLHRCAAMIVCGARFSSRAYRLVKKNMENCGVIMSTYEECREYLKEKSSAFCN